MNDNEFDYSEVENLDYRKPNSEFDIAFEKLQQAAQNLAEHKRGPEYTEKAEAYVRAAYPLGRLICSDESARQRLAVMAEQGKVDVRSHANNRDLLILFKIAQKRIGSATSASERNKWATIISYGLGKGMTVDALLSTVKALNGFSKAATHFAKLVEREDADDGDPDPVEEPTVEIKLIVSDLDTEISAIIPAALAASISKRIRAAAAANGGV